MPIQFLVKTARTKNSPTTACALKVRDSSQVRACKTDLTNVWCIACNEKLEKLIRKENRVETNSPQQVEFENQFFFSKTRQYLEVAGDCPRDIRSTWQAVANFPWTREQRTSRRVSATRGKRHPFNWLNKLTCDFEENFEWMENNSE